MKVMVTGGAGFIGSHLVDALVSRGDGVAVLDDLSTGKFENVNSQVNFYQGNIRDAGFVLDVVERERPRVIFHHAAQADVQTSVKDPASDAQINIIGTINLLEAARRNNVAKVVYASSAAVYGIPHYLPVDESHPVSLLSGYGISKYTVEHYLTIYKTMYGLDFTVLRYANVYGPRQDAGGEGGVVAIFLDRVLRDESPVIYGDGEQTRDFVFVRDVVAANLAAAGKAGGSVLNVSTGRATSVNRLFNMIAELTSSGVTPSYCPSRPGDIKDSRLDNTLANNVLDWNPAYELKDGLKETIKKWKKH
ncbi:MAG: UDP-glucose 4-epimerase [Peptococcaceae bacterium BRH_c4b]|nr:MAG: UDP-glucose 4-epimerase [Peptococcaceae bacterium BRH_c4b]